MSDLSQGQARNLEDLLKAYSRGPRRMLDPDELLRMSVEGKGQV